MKIFEKEESSWDSKVNFVDRNNVFIGFDTDQCCCETADWYISEKITPYDYQASEISTPENLEPYVFDKEFFESVESDDLDEGEMVVFKLVAANMPSLFLHIYNSHNGYYSHGLTVKHSDEVVKDISL